MSRPAPGRRLASRLLKLWVWAAKNRPSGDLSGYSAEDLELFCGWSGEHGSFAETLRELHWIDGEGENDFRLHGWREFQTWVCGVTMREDVGRLGILAKKTTPPLSGSGPGG